MYSIRMLLRIIQQSTTGFISVLTRMKTYRFFTDLYIIQYLFLCSGVEEDQKRDSNQTSEESNMNDRVSIFHFSISLLVWDEKHG